MITRIDNANDFEQLAGEWNALLRCSRANTLFLTWEWLHTWWRHLAGARQLFVLRVTRDSELVGLVPLVHTPPRLSTMRCGTLEFLGTGTVGSDYLDIIIRRGKESEVLDEVAAYVARQNCVLDLTQLRRQTASAVGLVDCWPRVAGPLRETPTNAAPWIPLTGHSWESYLASLSSVHRYNFRRRERKLKSKFAVRFEQAVAAGEVRTALARLIALHNQRRKLLGGSDAFHTTSHISFHEEVAQLALQQGWLRLFTLSLDDRPVSALYGFLYNGTFYFYQCGFDPAYSNYSVGLVTMGLSIERAFAEGAQEYDLLHGTERYKFHWASDLRELVRLELYPSGWRGAVWKGSRELNRALRKMVRNVLTPSEAEDLAVSTAKRGGAIYAPGPG